MGSTYQEDQGHRIDESANSSVQVDQIEHSQAVQEPQTEIKYSLRNRKVYHTLVVNGQTNNYSKLCLKNLQAIMTRDGYSATRRALRSHASICEVQNCPTCKFEIESRGYQFSPTNILNTTLIKNEIHTKQLITKKSVSFAQGTNFSVQANSAILDFKRINQAWTASTSLLETNLIS